MDADYRGNVGVVLFNHADDEFKIQKGDRIAQLICERILIPEILEVKVIHTFFYTYVHKKLNQFLPFQSLEETARGSAGFGSTGVH